MVSVGLGGREEELEDGMQGDVGIEDNDDGVFKGCRVEGCSGCVDFAHVIVRGHGANSGREDVCSVVEGDWDVVIPVWGGVGFEVNCYKECGGCNDGGGGGVTGVSREDDG